MEYILMDNNENNVKDIAYVSVMFNLSEDVSKVS